MVQIPQGKRSHRRYKRYNLGDDADSTVYERTLDMDPDMDPGFGDSTGQPGEVAAFGFRGWLGYPKLGGGSRRIFRSWSQPRVHLPDRGYILHI